jgi:purine-cytosine permease-like protein
MTDTKGPGGMPATGAGPDVAGRIEAYGINYITEEDRHSRPANIAWIMTGSCVTLPLIVEGWIPVALGLSWWASFWAVMLGSLFGALLLAPMAFLSPRTGTNNPMGSAAHFGVVGRIVGSFVGLLISILFTALAVWTGGQGIATSLNRLFGMSDSDSVELIWYTILTVVVVLVAVYGHATMLYLQKYAAWICGAILIIGIGVYAPDFDAGYSGGDLALGGFWPTWFAGFIPAALVVVGYSLAIGDWSRYISHERYSDKRIFWATMFGGIIGMGLPVLWGAYTAVTFSDPTADYVPSLVGAAPMWFVPLLFILGLGSGTAQGTVNMYSTGLDMSSILPRINRVPGTVFVGVCSYILVVVGAYNGKIIDNLTAFLDFLTIGFVSFVAVVIVGFWNHRGMYDSDALQVVVRGERGGRYWFDHGWNWRAVVAFVLATVAGILGLNDSWIKGPLVPLFGDISLGFIVSLVIGALAYLIFLWAFPEPDSAYVSGGPRVGRRAKAVLVATEQGGLTGMLDDQEKA